VPIQVAWQVSPEGGMAKQIERDGVKYIAERERFYCPCWDHCTQSRYMTYKWGWKLTREDGLVIFEGYDPNKKDCHGIARPDFRTFLELKTTVENQSAVMWEREIKYAQGKHNRKAAVV
jgi:hypothetical protein